MNSQLQNAPPLAAWVDLLLIPLSHLRLPIPSYCVMPVRYDLSNVAFPSPCIICLSLSLPSPRLEAERPLDPIHLILIRS